MDIKYIKYKTKYLNLKGGSVIQKDSVDNLIDVIHDGSLDITDKIKKLTNLIDEYEKKILNHKNITGLTPLNEAIKQYDSAVMCKLFIKNDVDVNLLDINKMPPLILAWTYFKHNICRFLLDSPDIDINCTNNEGETLLHIFALDEYFQNKLNYDIDNSKYVINRIIENGNINAEDYEHNTPLFNAVITSNLKFICMLKGKKPNAHKKFGDLNQTILDIAVNYEKKNNENGVKILKYLKLNYPELEKG